MNHFTLQWIVEEPVLLREFLMNHQISKRSLTSIKFDGGKIEVNGQESTVRRELKKGDLVKVIFPKEMISSTLADEDIPLAVVYEDEAILIVNKPPYMNTIPSREHPSGSLANALAGRYKKSGHYGGIHIATRLDRDTSGLILVAKHAHAHHLISLQQQQNLLQRKYTALIHGDLRPEAGTISAPIGRKSSSIIEREVRPDGKTAITNYKTTDSKNGISEVELKLETGRTHQIRVHLAYSGHPIVGDDLYGGERHLIKRQALHSRKLKLFHPLTKEEMVFEAPLPEDMQQILLGE
ncbi:RluA family pseudouridine synthase [Jeotgalibacillus proteolyticus]|uniref:Pseudouridine synthase n=1 Tax=Jeotgalibacillus proteolyticus TaxID=2082395 RepID=A0A2S5GH59_9BACL|nr:RluA family pseudouridine synthase [Jeotgalibacillus proteolyticus]PPA72316.1 RNA pseudouridine synthase [Jeotgalibacillus proteolyticus]